MISGLPYRGVKRVFDLTASAVLIVLTSPVMAGISFLIKKETPGTVFFMHDRMGLNGKHFSMYKFRSMNMDADNLEAILNDQDLEEYYQEFKLKKDPRITEIGRKLRRSSLDELPQLFNVLNGSMSLVGPRPIMETELDFYSEEEQTRLLSVKPGITGLWQVSGRNEITYASGERQELELYYADNPSFLLDLRILRKTPAAIIGRKGAF